MTFKDVFDAFVYGKKIRRNSWMKFRILKLPHGKLDSLERDDFLAADWEIVEEKPTEGGTGSCAMSDEQIRIMSTWAQPSLKKTKTVWQWRFTYNGLWKVSPILMSETEVNNQEWEGKYEKHAGPFEVEK